MNNHKLLKYRGSGLIATIIINLYANYTVD